MYEYLFTIINEIIIDYNGMFDFLITIFNQVMLDYNEIFDYSKDTIKEIYNKLFN
jgi:hypothetical protein